MRTVLCSGRLRGGSAQAGVYPGGGCLLREGLPGGVCLEGCLPRGMYTSPPLWTDDRRVQKHYLSATSFADGTKRIHWGLQGVLGAGTTYYCSISFIFMQISRKTFPNNRSLLQTQSLAPLPPSGKSWIRHCYCQVREWLEDILKLYATTISLVPRRKSH